MTVYGSENVFDNGPFRHRVSLISRADANWLGNSEENKMFAAFSFAQVNLAPVFWVALGFVALTGTVAVVSPKRFAALATRSNTWVDTNKLLEVFDRRVDVDHLVLPFSRVLGLAVLFAVGLLAFLYWQA